MVGIADGVIVASEMRSDGPWTVDFGCYGISLESGRLLWTSHADGWWGRFVRMLDFVPGFTNELRDAPVDVAGCRCTCGSGRVLDVRTGHTVRRLSKQEACAERHEAMTDAYRLYSTPALDVCPHRRLAVVRDPEASVGGLGLVMCDAAGTTDWMFALASTGYHMSHANCYTYRYAFPYVYVVASEEPSLLRESTYSVPQATFFHLLTVELERGTVVQDVVVSDARVEECRIEDVDASAVLLSVGKRHLRYYRRVGNPAREDG